MRGVATSDIHLGHRRFPATIDGRNAREVDVERAWMRAVDNMVEVDPDLVLIGGDIVDHPRVSVHAIMAWRDGLRRLVDETRAHVVAVQGNHDAVKTADSRTPIVIPGDYERVHIVLEPRRIRIPIDRTGELCSVACFPYRSMYDGDKSYRLEPDEKADVNALLMHAAVRSEAAQGKIPAFYAGDEAIDVGRETDRWDVIAVGDYHEPTRLTEDGLAFYPGSIERTSTDIWSERQEKGVVVYDTREGEAEFVPHETRRVSDWDLLDWDMDPLEPGPEHVNQALTSLQEEGYDGAMVRLKVEGFPREQRDQVDWETVRELKRNCLHFQLDLEWADRDSPLHRRNGDRSREGLREQALEFFREDRPAVRSCALEHLGFEEDDREREEEVKLVCPDCGNRDTSHPGDRPPCSLGCGGTMVPEKEIDIHTGTAAAGGAR